MLIELYVRGICNKLANNISSVLVHKRECYLGVLKFSNKSIATDLFETENCITRKEASCNAHHLRHF